MVPGGGSKDLKDWHLSLQHGAPPSSLGPPYIRDSYCPTGVAWHVEGVSTLSSRVCC